MSHLISRIRDPVRRKGAEKYLQMTLLSFAASVSLTRLILDVLNYPQLGNGNLHIAHVLYGGVILFASSLLPLIFANRWAYTWGAILSGVGVGLFIDEVGKFITQNNDYFYPAAAPIIYAFFLIVAIVYFQLSKPPEMDARSELYSVLESLEDILDHDLDEEEYIDLKARLERIRVTTKKPDFKRLAEELTQFIDSGALQTTPEVPNIFDKFYDFIKDFEERYISTRWLKTGIIIMLILLGVPSFLRFIRFMNVAGNQIQFKVFLENIVDELPNASEFNMMWAMVHVLLDGFIGFLLVLSGVLLLFGKNRRGVGLGSIALMVSLVGVNLVLFYIDQFSTIAVSFVEFITLQLLYYYQNKTSRTIMKTKKE